jgi:hypothetical protein
VLDASEGEVNTEGTKYMLMSGHQTAEQGHYVKGANKSFANMIQFKYFGTTVKNQSQAVH